MSQFRIGRSALAGPLAALFARGAAAREGAGEGLPEQGRWAAFVTEIATVVIGVLLALGAQTIVTGFDNREAAAEARQNIRAELAENLGRMAERGKTRDCIAARIDEIAAFLAGAGRGERQRAMHWIGRPQVWPVQQSRWDAAASAGHATLLSADEQADYGAIYANILDFRHNQEVEQAAWAQLRGMADLAAITAQQDAVLRQALQDARYTAWLINVNIVQATKDAARLGIRPHTDWVGSRSVCIASATPFDKALALAGGTAGLGEPR